MDKRLREVLKESNLIEGIHFVKEEEVKVATAFLNLNEIRIPDILNYANTLTVDRPPLLRHEFGQNIKIADHVPPLGGPEIAIKLQEILDDVNSDFWHPYENHKKYEDLHPLMDGNGRTGRLLFYFQYQKRFKGEFPPTTFLLGLYYYWLTTSRKHMEL